MAGKLTVSLSGSVTDSRNSANWSGRDADLSESAVQVTERTVPAAASRSRLAVQPGMTSVLADATLGSATLNWVVTGHRFRIHRELGR